MIDQSELSILDKIYTNHLPTLPPGASARLIAFSNEDTEFDKLIEVISHFPNITARLLALANSAWSSPASVITSLEGACSRLGFSIVKSTSRALAVASPFNPNKCPAFDPLRYWAIAFMSAHAAASLVSASTSIKELQPSSASTAGLLHNLGLLWLVDSLPGEVGQAIELCEKNQQLSLRQALQQVIGVDHAQAGGRLARHWDLPESLADAMGCYLEVDYQGEYREVVHSVGLAVELVSAVWAGIPCPAPDLRAAYLGLNEKELGLVFNELRMKLPRTLNLAKILFA